MYNVGLEEHHSLAVLTYAAKCHYSTQSQACDHEPRFASCCACVFFSSTLGIASPLSACQVEESTHLPFSMSPLHTAGEIQEGKFVRIEHLDKTLKTSSPSSFARVIVIGLDGTHIRLTTRSTTNEEGAAQRSEEECVIIIIIIIKNSVNNIIMNNE